MDTDDAAHAFIDAFQAVYRHTYRRRDPRAFHPGREALAMLQHLADTGPLTVAETARHLDRSQAAISERISALMARGLVDRIPDERDRRRHLVWLTEEGLAFVRDETQVLDPATLGRALERLAPRDREALIDHMHALVRACLDAAREETGHGNDEDAV